MERAEAKSSIKSLYLQAAALAGYEVGPSSPEHLVRVVQAGFSKVEPGRRAEAVANLLRLIAAALEDAQKKRAKMLHEDNVQGGHDQVCPVYPFGGRAQARKTKKS